MSSGEINVKSMPLAAVLFAGVSPFAFATTAFSADKVGSVLLSSGGLAEIENAHSWSDRQLSDQLLG